MPSKGFSSEIYFYSKAETNSIVICVLKALEKKYNCNIDSLVNRLLQLNQV